MKIAILLSKPVSRPIGGYKQIFEYANYLSNINNVNVTIYYSGFISLVKEQKSFIFVIWGVLRFIYFKIFGIHIKWFNFNTTIKHKYVFDHSNKYIEESNIYIATALQTSFELAKMQKQNSFYFIQGFENWGNVTDEMVYESYKLPLKKIVISKGLLNKINALGEKAILVPNGFNCNKFYVSKEIRKRDPYCISTMYHIDSLKGFDVVQKALDILKRKYPKLKVLCFGAYKKPSNLPEWYSYTYRATESDLHTIYNNSSIYVSASYSEGWGLTIGEAMNCGCAICCTDNDGFKMMVNNNVTGLISKCGNITDLATNIELLILNNALREKLAQNAIEYIKNYSIEESFSKFRNALEL